MEEAENGHSVHARILGDPQGDISKKLSLFFANRRKSGGGENQVMRLSSTLYKICFKEKEVQERVLNKEHHEIKLSTQDPIAVQVTRLATEEDTAGAPLAPSSCGILDSTAVPVSPEAERVPESSHIQDFPPVRSESFVPNPHIFCLIEKHLRKELGRLCPGMAWSVDPSHSHVTFEGTSEAVLLAKTALKKLLGMVLERPVELPGYELAFLLTLTKMNFLEEAFHDIELEVVLQICNTYASLLGLDMESVKLANDILCDLLDHKILVDVKDWTDLSEGGGSYVFMNSLLKTLNHPLKRVDIRVTPVGSLTNILVVGCTKSVQTVIKEMEIFLGRMQEPVDPAPTSTVSSCSQEEERLDLPNPSLAASFDQFLTLVDPEDSLKGKVTWSLAPSPSCAVILRGPKQDVEHAREKVTSKLQALHSTELVLDKPGAQQYFRSRGKEYLALLLKTHKCLVLLQDSKIAFREMTEDFWVPKPQQVAAAPGGLRFHSFQQSGCTSCTHVKNVVIECKLGKVEAEEMDVIINLLSSAYDRLDTPLFHAAGDSVQKEFRRKEDKSGLTYTGAGRLRCKIIIHVRLSHLLYQQDTLRQILKDCDSKREYRSVCLFLTDTGNVPLLEAAGILVDALAMTAAQLIHLTLIKIVTSEERLSNAFQSTLESCCGKLVPEEPQKISFFQALFGWGASDSANKSSKATEDNWLRLKAKSSSKPAVLQLFAEKEETLKRVTQTISAYFTSLYSKHILRDPALEHLTRHHLETIYLAIRHTGVVVSKAKDCLKLEGTDSDVEEVKTLVESTLKEVKAANEKEEGKWLLAAAHWQYEEKRVLKDFSTLDSCQLERGYQLGQVEVNLQREGRRKMVVNFQTMQAQVPEDNKYFHVQRKERLMEKGLPATWKEGTRGRKAEMIQLTRDSQEYQTVEKRFNRSASRYQIQSIERIQCIPLYEAYRLRKKQMEEKNGQEVENERILYHGTCPETSMSICEHGFNRSFNKRSLFGHGVYFAVNAEYSTERNYSNPNSDGLRTLIQARVLTGKYTLGRPELRAAPPRTTSSDHDLFDSVVDRMESPSIFVVFHDTQAYPEYRITFK